MAQRGGFKTGGVGVNDNDIIFDLTDVSDFDTFMFLSETGAMDVFVSLDGTHYTTSPISLADFGAVVSDPVIVTAPHRLYGLRGKFKKLRIMQNGATAVTGAAASYGTMGA